MNSVETRTLVLAFIIDSFIKLDLQMLNILCSCLIFFCSPGTSIRNSRCLRPRRASQWSFWRRHSTRQLRSSHQLWGWRLPLQRRRLPQRSCPPIWTPSTSTGHSQTRLRSRSTPRAHVLRAEETPSRPSSTKALQDRLHQGTYSTTTNCTRFATNCSSR